MRAGGAKSVLTSSFNIISAQDPALRQKRHLFSLVRQASLCNCGCSGFTCCKRHERRAASPLARPAASPPVSTSSAAGAFVPGSWRRCMHQPGPASVHFKCGWRVFPGIWRWCKRQPGRAVWLRWQHPGSSFPEGRRRGQGSSGGSSSISGSCVTGTLWSGRPAPAQAGAPGRRRFPRSGKPLRWDVARGGGLARGRHFPSLGTVSSSTDGRRLCPGSRSRDGGGAGSGGSSSTIAKPTRCHVQAPLQRSPGVHFEGSRRHRPAGKIPWNLAFVQQAWTSKCDDFNPDGTPLDFEDPTQDINLMLARDDKGTTRGAGKGTQRGSNTDQRRSHPTRPG